MKKMCHVLFFVPIVSLFLFGVFPWQEAAGLYALINSPLLLAGWLIWRVHRRPAITGREGMIGRRATAKELLDPEGVVICGNELWRAHSEVPIEAGKIVRVVGMNKLELCVLPCWEGEPKTNNSISKGSNESQEGDRL